MPNMKNMIEATQSGKNSVCALLAIFELRRGWSLSFEANESSEAVTLNTKEIQV